MPSTIATFPVALDLGDGTEQLLATITTKVWSVAGGADVATVVTDANGNFPATAVSGAVGSVYRIRVESYFGRAGYYEAISV